jgi:hypothetical protein
VTNLHATGAGWEPQPNSKYVEIEDMIKDRAYNTKISGQTKSLDYEEKVVGDILGGATGKSWRQCGCDDAVFESDSSTICCGLLSLFLIRRHLTSF